MRRSDLTLTSFDCGLQKLVHRVSKVISLSVKPHDTTNSITSTPDHEISLLHCLLIVRVASSFQEVSHHHVALCLWTSIQLGLRSLTKSTYNLFVMPNEWFFFHWNAAELLSNELRSVQVHDLSFILPG